MLCPNSCGVAAATLNSHISHMLAVQAVLSFTVAVERIELSHIPH